VEQAKRARLNRAGFKVGTAAEFLRFTPGEQAAVDFKLGLSSLLRRRREARQLSQTVLAKKIGSSQSRVAKMEAGDPSVSMDLLMHAVFASGATSEYIANELREIQLRSS